MPEIPDSKPARGAHPPWWMDLTPEEREIHYNRTRKCDHKYVYPGINGNVNDGRLREAYSFDPYAHTPHLIPHQLKNCECQICIQKIGIWQGRMKD